MECGALKREITYNVRNEVLSLLKEIEPQVVASITDMLRSEFDKRIFEQDDEIAYLKERIKRLEESISWAAHKLGTDL